MNAKCVLVLWLAGFTLCSYLPADTVNAKKVAPAVNSYISAFMDGRLSDAYAMLAADERDGVTLSQFESYIRATFPTADLIEPVRVIYPSLYAFSLQHLYDVSIAGVEEIDGIVYADVDLSTIDLLTMAFEISRKYPEIDSGDLSVDETDAIYRKALSELYGETDPPSTVIEVRIGVASEFGKAVVYPGIRESFDRMRAGELSGKAWLAKFDGRNEYAAQLYREAVELDPENELYAQELDDIQMWLKESERLLSRPASTYVTDHIVVEKIKVEMTGSPAFLCEIRNSGDLLLGWIEARVAYLDELDLLMDVEFIRYDFRDTLLDAETTRDIRLESSEAPFGWPGVAYRLDIMDAGT